MAKLKALFKKVSDKYNALSDNQMLHVRTIGWILGIIAAITLFLFMITNFTDFTIVLFAFSVVAFICWAIYMFVFTMVKTSNGSKRRK